MTPKEMLEKITELEYSRSQLKLLNAEMRHLLDVADDELTALRSENAAHRKQVKALEQMVSEAQQVEAEPCKRPLVDDPDVQRCNEKKMQKLEEESTLMKEENKQLTEEIKSLQEQREQDKINLSKFSVALNTLEFSLEEAQIGLQQKDEVIKQKDLQLKQAEETVEECSNIMKDLRLTNQELRNQLEERQDEASFAILSDRMGDKEGALILPPLSFAEEIKCLASSAEVMSSTSSSTERRHEGMEPEEQLGSLSVTLQTSRSPSDVEPIAKSVRLFLLCVFILTVFVAAGGCAGHLDCFSINALWRNANLMLEPYCSMHYRALPPV